MSKRDAATKEQTRYQQTVLGTQPRALHPYRPFVTAADVAPGEGTTVQLNEEIYCILYEHADGRAPKNEPESFHNHLVGIVGERAVSAWLGVPLDARITDDYEGDRGYDLESPQSGERPLRIEVKTAQDQNPQATIGREEVDKADVFVLCRANRGLDWIEIVGHATRPMVKKFGDHYSHPGYHLVPEYLRPTRNDHIPPEEIQRATYSY